MFETVEKLQEISAMLEHITLAGSSNMLTLITAIANLNDVIKEMRGENDVQTE